MRDKYLYQVIIGTLTLLACLPLKALYVLSDFIYLIVYHLIRYRRQTVSSNLELVFPRKSSHERREIEQKYYHHFCDCIVETIKLLHISDREIDERIEVTNGKLIEKLAEDGRSIILFLGHYGNWEWVQAVTRHYSRPAISGQIYRPLHNPVMEQVMQKIRSRFPTFSIPQKKAFRTLLRLRNENKQALIGFISDQRPNSANLHHWATFLNQDTAYNVGGDEIGNRINANYAYLEVEKVKRGYYRLTFKLISLSGKEAEYPYSLKFMEMMEKTILRAPEYWLWSHKRWRYFKNK